MEFTMRRGMKRAGSSTASSRGSAKELEAIQALFAAYQDESIEEPAIGPEGIERLCEDLDVPPTDIRMLMFAYKLGAVRMGYFTQEEWRRGLLSMRVDSMEKLKECFSELEVEVHQTIAFREFFKYAFQYCCTEPRQKTLDLDTAAQMLQLVMPVSHYLEPFLEFLSYGELLMEALETRNQMEQSEYKALTLDQWQGFLRFSEETPMLFQMKLQISPFNSYGDIETSRWVQIYLSSRVFEFVQDFPDFIVRKCNFT